MITLSAMTTLARALLDAEQGVKDAESALTAAKEKARMLREETIPSAMQELGLKSMVLETGQQLKIMQDVYASIPEDNKIQVYNWLDANQFGGLIKTKITVELGKGEKEQALKLFFELQKREFDVAFGQGVHPQTLKAFLKEQISNGSDIPLDLFGARPIWTAKLSQK